MYLYKNASFQQSNKIYDNKCCKHVSKRGTTSFSRFLVSSKDDGSVSADKNDGLNVVFGGF